MSGQIRFERVQARSTHCSNQPSGTLSDVNVWLAGADQDVVIIDPAGDPAAIIGAVGDRWVTAVICTHGHRSHIGAAMEVGTVTCAPVLIHPADHSVWDKIHGPSRYWRLDDGQRIAVAGVEIRVLHTPSPTPGSISLHIASEAAVFSGDTLPHPGQPHPNGYRSGCETGSWMGLPRHTRIYPGHGDPYILEDVYSQDGRLVHHVA